MRPSFTLGIEEEYQTVDPATRDLRSHIKTELLAKGKRRLEERVKAEMHQSVIEVGTRICRTIDEAREDLYDLRRQMIQITQDHDLVLVAGATHPFADWSAQDIYPDERYERVVEDLQQVARANLIFGLHVHVGIEDKEAAIRVMNSMRYFLPHILALSTNSPFWRSRDTGLKSYRAKVFDKFPRTNIPDSFGSWGEYEQFCNLLVKTNCMDNAKKIWWDIRPHPFFNTIEVRICDIPMRAEETIAIAALIQATACKLWKLQATQPGLAPVQSRAADGKQMARRALRARRQAHRLRQRGGGRRARTDPRISGVRRRLRGRPGQPRCGRRISKRFSRTVPAPSGRCANSRRAMET